MKILLLALALLLTCTTTAFAQNSDGERIARLEGAYEHLATKADIANLRNELQKDMDGLRNELM